jgi:hypothetical protein
VGLAVTVTSMKRTLAIERDQPGLLARVRAGRVLASVALLVTGVTIPKLDGSSKEPAYVDMAARGRGPHHRDLIRQVGCHDRGDQNRVGPACGMIGRKS